MKVFNFNKYKGLDTIEGALQNEAKVESLAKKLIEILGDFKPKFEIEFVSDDLVKLGADLKTSKFDDNGELDGKFGDDKVAKYMSSKEFGVHQLRECQFPNSQHKPWTYYFLKYVRELDSIPCKKLIIKPYLYDNELHLHREVSPTKVNIFSIEIV